MRSYLDFEKPVAELEAKVEELRAMQAAGNGADTGADPDHHQAAVAGLAEHPAGVGRDVDGAGLDAAGRRLPLEAETPPVVRYGIVTNRFNLLEYLGSGYVAPRPAFDKYYADLLERASFLAPDDGNADDKTVLSVPLATPVAPGASITIDLTNTSLHHKVFERAEHGAVDHHRHGLFTVGRNIESAEA